MSELISRRFASHQVLLESPEAEALSASLLFVDISGFTTLAEQLTKQGSFGAERLSEILNGYFQFLISRISDYGGDVVKFAGDAILAIWLDEGKGLDIAISRVAQCALSIQKDLVSYESQGGLRLLLHISISAGKVTGMHVGGYRDRWHYILTGEPLNQLGLAINAAHQGDVVLTPEAWKFVVSRGHGTPVGNGCVKIESIWETPLKQASVSVPVEQDADAVFRAYIFDSLLTIGETPWLAELRRVTAMFVNLPDLDHSSSRALQNIQFRMQMFQEILFKYEGCIKDLIIDDKGPTLVVLFGTPPFSHEDDPLRAIRSAMEIKSNLQVEGMQAKIGVATGRCFCGIIGGEIRREYAVIGEVMNASSRLMQAASNNEIFCDEETFQIAKSRFEFKHQTFALKGKVNPIAVHSPLHEVESSRHAGQIVGRVTERMKLSGYLDDLVNGESRVIVLEGEPGIGKSRLTLDLIDHSSSKGIRSFIGSGDAIEKSTPYYAWRPIFNDILGLKNVLGLNEKRKLVMERLDENPDLLPLSPLINSVLSLEIPDNEVTANLPAKIRAETTRYFLASLLRNWGEKEGFPMLIVLEDAHWMDASSWALAYEISKHNPHLLLLIVTRPLDENLPNDVVALLQMQETVRLQLVGLSEEETSSIVRERLGLKDLEHSIAKLIHDRTEGNPFFCQEIAYALRDSGLIAIQEGRCSIAPALTELTLTSFPNTIQGVISSRIDRLPPSHQLTLKVASVIGREFESRILEDIHPEIMQRSLYALSEDLDNLQRVDLIHKEKLEPYLTYLFKHALTQDVAYNLLLFSQRRLLHRAVAEFYERALKEDLVPIYPLLAYHWGRAEVNAKALNYVEKAGEVALRGGAIREAISFYREALKILDQSKAKDEVARRQHSEYQLGQAYFALANWKEARDHLGKALTIMHQAPPESRMRLGSSIVQQILFQLAHRLLPNAFIGRTPNSSNVLNAAHAYERFAEMSVFQNEPEVLLYSTLKELNLAERAGNASNLARAYAGAALVVGTIPIQRLAKKYRSLARKVAKRVEDLPSLAFVGQTLGFYESGIGEWEDGCNDLELSIEVSEKASDWDRWEECASAFGASLYLQSKFSESTKQFTAVVDRAAQRGNRVHQGWGLSGQGENLFRIGDTNHAIKLLRQSLGYMNEKEDRVFQMGTQGLLAVAYIRLGDFERARQEADRTLDYIRESRPTLVTQFEGYAGATEALLALWESGKNTSHSDASDYFSKSARVACRALWSFAKVFPIGEPRGWFCQGWSHRLQNRLRDAQRDWNRGLTAAKKLRMPYEAARLHYEIGRFLEPSNPERMTQLTEACKIFGEVGAKYDLVCAKIALG